MAQILHGANKLRLGKLSDITLQISFGTLQKLAELEANP
jgi:hypothetical protein